MRNLKYYLMLGIAVMLASCSQNEEALQVGNNEAEVRASFRLTADDGPQTRAAVTGLTRYCIEVYAKGNTDAAPVYSKYDNTDGQFDMDLRKDHMPATILFWADYGDTYYDVSAGLKQISMTATAAAAASDAKSEAFFHKLTDYMPPADGSVANTNISLKRAVAKVVLTETIGLGAGKPLTATFDHYPQFNAATETTVGTAASRTVSFDNPDGIAANTEVGSFTAFAPKAEKAVATFTFGYDGETRQLANVPLQANYQTKITGRFDPHVNQLFNITTDESWNTADHTGSWLKVGDDYTHTANSQEYQCVLVSIKHLRVVVVCKMRMPGDAGECKQYAETLVACQALGGRFPTEEEFKVLHANGLVDAGSANYAINVSGDGVNNCAQIVDGALTFIPADDRALYYHLVFDIEM